jgi:hypothetical protein
MARSMTPSGEAWYAASRASLRAAAAATTTPSSAGSCAVMRRPGTSPLRACSAS